MLRYSAVDRLAPGGSSPQKFVTSAALLAMSEKAPQASGIHSSSIVPCVTKSVPNPKYFVCPELLVISGRNTGIASSISMLVSNGDVVDDAVSNVTVMPPAVTGKPLMVVQSRTGGSAVAGAAPSPETMSIPAIDAAMAARRVAWDMRDTPLPHGSLGLFVTERRRRAAPGRPVLTLAGGRLGVNAGPPGSLSERSETKRLLRTPVASVSRSLSERSETKRAHAPAVGKPGRGTTFALRTPRIA